MLNKSLEEGKFCVVLISKDLAGTDTTRLVVNDQGVSEL
jgi:hypothetical protein